MADRPITLFDHDMDVLHGIQKVKQERSQRNWNNHVPLVNVPIPNTVVLNCPKVKPAMRYATLCRDCECFKGVGQAAWDDTKETLWTDKYVILCAFTLERKTHQVVIE